ncbi:MAG: hypothetical protein MUE44_20810 [Oscillatoriaceae cyanobacterium Prado104]|jgi:hypothetical protein|nr:hypothetical protein [Oscillatoriaceae cyanobacterium Prado104]
MRTLQNSIALIHPATSTTVQSAAVETAIHPPKVDKFLDRPCHRNNPKDRSHRWDEKAICGATVAVRN